MNFDLPKTVGLQLGHFFNQRWVILFGGVKICMSKGGAVTIPYGITNFPREHTPFIKSRHLRLAVQHPSLSTPGWLEVVCHNENQMLLLCAISHPPYYLSGSPKRIPGNPGQRPLEFG
jgi:hypothetical protein